MNISEILDIFEKGITMPFSYIINPKKRIYFIYLFTSLILAFYVYKKLKIKGSFFTYLLPKKAWLGTSSKVDYTLIFFNSFIKTLLIGPYLILGLYLAFYTNEFLLRSFGFRDSLRINPYIFLLIYTLTLTIINDFFNYLIHLALHKIPFLWEFHKIHHSATELNPLTLYRLHPIELIINNARSILVFGVITGVFDYFSNEQINKITFIGVNVFSFLFLTFGSNLRHSHIKVTYYNFIEYVFISPFQHQIHHSDNPKHFDKNMGSKFALWDWIFGTLVRSNEVNKINFGLGKEDTINYNTFWKNIYKPFTNIYNRIYLRLKK